MIGRLSGVLAFRASDHVLLDVRGVGYVVYCSERTLAALPSEGEATTLYTDLLVREDLLQLFGFLSPLEKEWHRLLMSVQGVGAKASMAILSALGPDGIGRAIALGDWGSIKAAKGIGPKTAQRVVNELKDKAPQVMAMGAEVSAPIEIAGDVVEAQVQVAPVPQPVAAKDQASALSALVNLGYGQGEAASAVAAAAGEGVAGEAELIRSALRLLAPKG